MKEALADVKVERGIGVVYSLHEVETLISILKAKANNTALTTEEDDFAEDHAQGLQEALRDRKETFPDGLFFRKEEKGVRSDGPQKAKGDSQDGRGGGQQE